MPPKTYWDSLDASAPNARLWRAAWGLIEKEVFANGEPAREQEILPHFSVGTYEATAPCHNVSEDCVLLDSQQGIFGVFDGMGGGGGNPAAAAQAARDAVFRILNDAAPSNINLLRNLMRNSFDRARYTIDYKGEGGSTVGTAIKICVIDGAAVMGVAHAGDTRLFRFNKDEEKYEALTSDQSKGNVVHNSLSPGTTNEKDEYKVFNLALGDRIMLCSDGITGDWSHQFLTDVEFMRAFQKEHPQDCAETFFRLSKKTDDKSVLVIDIE